MVPAATAPSRRPRGPALVYTSLLTIAAVLSALFLLTAPPIAPPAIAEFAPAVTQRITQAPQQQAVQPGQGNGAAPARPPTPTPTPVVDTSSHKVPKQFDCVGGRQIHDPQSPPCVAAIPPDVSNGGSTWQGVTGDGGSNTIEIVAPDWAAGNPEAIDMQTFFNNHFNFYHRTIHIDPVAGLWDGSCTTKDLDQWADDVQQTYHPFASLDTTSCEGAEFRDRLAQTYRVLSVGYQQLYTEAHMASLAPYLWQYPLANDRMFAQTADWMCSRLVGGDAMYAGDPSLKQQQRVFAVLFMSPNSYYGYGGDDNAFVTEFRDACGGKVITAQANANDAQTLNSIMVNFRQQKVSTILCLCYGYQTSFGLAQDSATNQGYFPEWVIDDYNEIAESNVRSQPQQGADTIGLTFMPMDINEWDDPAIWAFNEARPGTWTQADEDTTANDGGRWALDGIYREMLLLASGLQMAGPHLTPYTFQDGLQSTTFPNPANPIMAGKVGFAGGSHSMTIDAAELWWSNSGKAPYSSDGAGAFCYVAGGARRSTGSWPPASAPFETGTCYSGAQRVYG